MSEAKFIVPFEYRVTEDGRVFSVATNWRGYGEREMAQHNNSHGYPSVRIIIGGRRKRIAVHRMVAARYLPEKPSPEHEIRHLNGNKEDNRFENLMWGTKSENALDRGIHGTQYIPDWGNKEFREKAIAGMRRFYESP